MRVQTIIGTFLTLALAIGLTTATFAADKEANLKAKAKISKAEATKTALAKVPGGKVKEAELEEEKGKIIWSFDIAVKGSKDITEVQVDAITGEVVSVEKETPEDQKKEKEQDKK